MPLTGSARRPRSGTSLRARSAPPGAGRACRLARTSPPSGRVISSDRASPGDPWLRGSASRVIMGSRAPSCARCEPLPIDSSAIAAPSSANGSIQPAWSPAPCRTAATARSARRTRSAPARGRWAGTRTVAFGSGAIAWGDPGGSSARGGCDVACAHAGARWARSASRSMCASEPCLTRIGIRPGPPTCPSTRPKPLYSNVRSRSVLLVELPTYGRLRGGRQFDDRRP